MSIFEDQIRARRKADQEDFEDSIRSLAGAVMGERMRDALYDNRQVTVDAIGDILKYYHVKSVEVPEDIQDLNEMLEIVLRPHGIMQRPVKLDAQWSRKAAGPMLASRKDDGSVVALIPLGVRHYYFYDHKVEKPVVITHRNKDLIDRDAIVFYKPFPQRKLTTGSLLAYMAGQVAASDLLHLIMDVAAVTGVGMLLPWLSRVLFSDVLSTGSVPLYLGAGIFLVCASLSRLLFTQSRDILCARISIRLSVQDRKSVV